MTTREREQFRQEISAAMRLLVDVKANIALDDPHGALDAVALVEQQLLTWEGRVGCYTPQGLFQEA